MTEVAIVNVGLGNIASVANILKKVGAQANIISEPNKILRYQKIILPGVGHYDEGVKRLRETGFFDAIQFVAKEANPHILGICLGMQLLCRGSEEGTSPGLGIIAANVAKFSFSSGSKRKVPHMGWNVVVSSRENRLLPVSIAERRFYFVHSYKVIPDDSSIIIGKSSYGEDFCSAFQQGNVFGVQFHPEKSHRFGADMMRNFVGL